MIADWHRFLTARTALKSQGFIHAQYCKDLWTRTQNCRTWDCGLSHSASRRPCRVTAMEHFGEQVPQKVPLKEPRVFYLRSPVSILSLTNSDSCLLDFAQASPPTTAHGLPYLMCGPSPALTTRQDHLCPVPPKCQAKKLEGKDKNQTLL